MFMFQYSPGNTVNNATDFYTSVTQDVVGFNTQPPEGGCPALKEALEAWRSFNTQPPEGGWRD